MHISELPSDYFHFDAGKHMLLGERTGKRYRLGDRLRVKVVRVDLETSKIDFVLTGGIQSSNQALEMTAMRSSGLLCL